VILFLKIFFSKTNQTQKGIFGTNTTSASSPASIHVRTAKAPCQMREIKWKRGKSTGGQKVEDATFIEAGDEAEVVFVPKMPFCVDAYDVCKPLGRMAAMDSNSLIMLGRVLSCTKKTE
jgi:elongation factor 1-alpha